MFISKNCTNFAVVIELERHIEILLLSNDCVIVPNLGGFMAHHVDARYEEEEQAFLPPLRTLGFNPQLSINDSLLAQSYVEAYDISYPEALQRIEDDVNELKSHLQEEGVYELNDIGTLALNEDGNYVFTPCEAGILTPSLYGLSSFEMARLAAPAEKETAAKVVDITPKPQIVVEEKAEAPVEEAADNDDDVVKIKYTWIRNTVAIAAVLLAIFLLALPTGKTEMMTRTISNLNHNILFGMMSQDTNTSKIDIKKSDIIKPAAKTDSLIKESSDTIKTAPVVKQDVVKKGYCIVLASHVSKKNAEAFVSLLKNKGIDSAEVFMHNDIRRVIVGNFATQEEAYQTVLKIHKNKGLEEAWVYKYN